jgi:ubiquinone/menaquinone biosynthesis C-methylase UbiE
MIEETISAQKAQKYYDRLGARYDWAAAFESRAKERALALFAPSRGEMLLNVGAGTGLEHQILHDKATPGGAAVGLDLSFVMSTLTRSRSGAPVCQADAGWLPFENSSFDGVYCAYTLDLIPTAHFPKILNEIRAVLKPGGRIALLSLTEGIDFSSRAIVAAWKLAYAISPISCGGCRPLRMQERLQNAGFKTIHREVIVQMGVPSELILAAAKPTQQNSTTARPGKV